MIVRFCPMVTIFGVMGRERHGRQPRRTVMTEQIQPLEEREEVANAIADDVAVDAFMTGGGPDADTPTFREPDSPEAAESAEE
jgi:hypothetical protein